MKKKVSDEIVERIKAVAGEYSAKKYKQYLDGMNQEQFDAYIDRLEAKEEYPVIEEEQFGSSNISFENNLAVARSMGRDFYYKISYGSVRPGVPAYEAAVPCLVLHMPVKRPVQMAYKKLTVPTNYSTVNELTGQVTGRSKGSSITAPEIMLLDSMKLGETMEDVFTARGGDKGFQDAMYAALTQTGSATLESTRGFATGVKSIQTFDSMLKGMHIKTKNLNLK